MAELRSQDKRDKLRLIWQAIQSANSSGDPNAPEAQDLQDALLALLKVCDDAINGPTPGTFLSNSNEAGGSFSFQMLRDLSPVFARRLIGEMLDAYDHVVDWLQTNVTNGAQPTDQQIYDGMMKHAFCSVRKYRSDFTGGRYGIGFYLGTS